MGKFYVSNIAVVITKLYAFVKTDEIVHIKLVNFVVHNLSLILILKTPLMYVLHDAYGSSVQQV